VPTTTDPVTSAVARALRRRPDQRDALLEEGLVSGMCEQARPPTEI
jgi:hypothetical protein